MIGRLLRLWRSRDDAGITLLEVTITLALLSLVTFPAGMWLGTMQRSDLFVGDATRQLADTRLALEGMARTIRPATYAFGDNAFNSSIFHSAGDFHVTFYVDANGDGIAERVSYDFDQPTSSIRKTSITPACGTGADGRMACDYATGVARTSTVVQNVRNDAPSSCPNTTRRPIFSYYKVDPGTGEPVQLASSGGDLSVSSNDINDLVDINFVQVEVVVDLSPGRGPNCTNLKTSVQLRNWRGSL